MRIYVKKTAMVWVRFPSARTSFNISQLLRLLNFNRYPWNTDYIPMAGVVKDDLRDKGPKVVTPGNNMLNCEPG